MPNTVSRYSRSKPRYSGATGSSSAILLVVQLSPTYWHATHGQYVTICTRAQSKLYLNNHNIQDVYWNFRDVVVLDLRHLSLSVALVFLLQNRLGSHKDCVTPAVDDAISASLGATGDYPTPSYLCGLLCM